MKYLVNPFLWCLLLQLVGLLALQRGKSGRNRIVVRALLFLTLFLAMSATPAIQKGMETSLMLTPPSSYAVTPAFIFVLGGGYYPGFIPDEDVLVAESQQRVLHGVTLWRRYPNARMIFSGTEYEYNGIYEADRLVQLMAETARSKGVPASMMLLESRSRNTREHPIEALKLPGVSPEIPIAVVTSSWHMRRAKREFSRYFYKVQPYPVPERQRPLSWNDFIPDADTLSNNTTLLREWVGMFWYEIR